MKLRSRAILIVGACVALCYPFATVLIEDSLVRSEVNLILRNSVSEQPIDCMTHISYAGGVRNVRVVALFSGKQPISANSLRRSIETQHCKCVVIEDANGAWMSTRATGPVDSWYAVCFSRSDPPNYWLARSWLMD